MLELKNISKSFTHKKQEKQILQQISLRVEEGEFVSVIGPSGSGKTTLFQIIGGLEPVNSGEVWINGKQTTGQRGHVAYMPQQASLMPWYSVKRNIALALQVAGISKQQAEQQANEWLQKVGLGEYADAYPHMLSGGMSQRVSFLRALLSPQTLMLLDEPFGALDALTRLHMQQWLLSIWEENRRSVLLVTHSIEEALLLSDRIIVLSSSPATIVDEIIVPFARPRASDLWSTPTFNELKQRIYEQLHTNN
ncbi:MAG: ABC transporter ATP-binding protein [Candidatus Pristimantibacillus lignocellulolyticus]|uniref:ABC transporter ATP-binding protein n=1 Tax=Candidatus Pristimantibacillus lignocellulolyticus TaxID=2994561 RepID=A0A9J6ZBM9_9BACL|nr:MAG: ABC transporter ATP-binding protein [Candidatus Pristimantibacillus lignocellulolyticus]